MTVAGHRPAEAEIARRFAEFAAGHRGYSPLYAHLADGVAADPDLLALLAAARPGQRRPVLLFAAVQYLLLGGVGGGHRLRDHYPSLGGHLAADTAWPAFREFCLDHREELLDVVATRNTQTNEVGRCAALYPALSLATGLAGGPLGLVEIGSSAGLILRIDRYGYRYSTGQRAGADLSPLTLECDLTGPEGPPAAPTVKPPFDPPVTIGARVGIDLAPIDTGDDDAVRWLAACVYADQTERAARLRAAVDLARTDPVEVPLVRGAALDVLADVIDGLPAEVTPCLLHTWVVTYFRREDRARLLSLVGEMAARRPLLWISSEPPGTLPGLGRRDEAQSGWSVLALAQVNGPEVRWQRLGRVHSHGAWLGWSGPSGRASAAG